MPVVNPLARELVRKIVYYVPGLGGKTTTLQYIHATAKPEHRGKLVSLATPVDRTLYFDFLPLRLPNVRGMSIRLQLFTVPGQVHYNATRKLVLTGVDGIVMVFDSQSARADANLETLDNLNENLRTHGRELSQVPHVIQYNKRDLAEIATLDELERALNRHAAPSFATAATNGEGVYEGLEAITRAALEDFERRAPESRVLVATTLALPEEGLVEALRRAEDRDLWSEAQIGRGARTIEPIPSGVLNLSDAPESDPGEDAARAVLVTDHPLALQGPVTFPSPGAERAPAVDVPPMSEPEPALRAGASAAIEPRASGVSFEPLWPLAGRDMVGELERAFAAGAFDLAVSLAEKLVARSLASAAGILGGSADAPRDPASVALLLGLDGRRYLEFRALVRDVRAGRGAAVSDALSAYAMAIEARLARARLGS
jgi:mutual gliding-motility protein MglA